MQDYSAARMAMAFIRTKKVYEVSAEAIMVKIREFLGQFISSTDIDPDLNLFESGMVSSLFAMQLILFVEKEFGIEVANEDLDFNNFRSLNAITAFIMAKEVTP